MRIGRVVAALSLALVSGCSGAPSGSLPPPPSSDGRTHVVVDTDLGPDDVVALLYLLRRDDVVIDAVTLTGDGLVHCEPGVDNARALLALGGSPDTPVACGRATPLEGVRGFPPLWRTFADDLSILRLPTPTPTAGSAGSAVDLLRSSLTGDVDLLTLGPFTNVAEALRADPGLADRIGSMTSMAGAFDVAGNAPGLVAEYNAWVDPVATAEVLGRVPTTLVPLDATNGVPITPSFMQALWEHRTTPEARAVYTVLSSNPQVEAGASYFWDPLAAALLVEPGLGTTETTPVRAGVGDVDPGVTTRGDGPSLAVTTDADALGFEEQLLSTLSGAPSADVRPHPAVTVRFDGSRCEVDSRPVVPAGSVLVAFRNEADASALVVVGTLRGTTYERFLTALGGPGSIVERSPPGYTTIAAVPADPGATIVTRVMLPVGSAVAACAVQNDDALRAWPGAPLSIG